VLVDGDGVVLEPIVGQESHMIVRSSAADALVHVPRGNGEVAAGSTARWFRLAG
jgi:molybdopterin biosynthesis enzyme